MPIPQARLQQKLASSHNSALQQPIYLFLPIVLFVGMIWHTANTLADIESGGDMGMALSIAKLFLVFIETERKINGVRSWEGGECGDVFGGTGFARCVRTCIHIFLLICNGTLV